MKPRAALMVLTAVVLAGCASDEPNYRSVARGGYGHGGGGGGDEARREAGLPNVFISPAGKPYRASAGDPYPVAAWFAAADTNHDRRITLEEFRADAITFFNELDTDHNGVVDGFEISTYEQKIAPEILPRIEGLGAGEGMDLALGKHSNNGGPEIGAARGMRGGRESAGDRRPQGAGLFGLLNEPEPVTAADANFDGKVTKDEFLAAADRRFQALDTKGAGVLTLGALPKTPVQQALEVQANQKAQHR